MDHQKRQVHRSGPVSGLRSKRLMGYFCHPTRRHSHLGLSNWTIVVSTRRVRGTDRAGTDRNQYIRGLSTVTSYFVLPLPISSVFFKDSLHTMSYVKFLVDSSYGSDFTVEWLIKQHISLKMGLYKDGTENGWKMYPVSKMKLWQTFRKPPVLLIEKCMMSLAL